MPKPNDRCVRGRARSMMNSLGFSMLSSSRLPETYHITTRSPLRIFLSPISVSTSAVRRMCASGVCQRITSGTMESISAGSSRSFWYCSGNSFNASTEPLMVLRVVSLPPTISRMMLPIRLSGSMCRVAALFGRFHDPALGQCGRDVGPACQLAALLERKIEQGGQHLRGQFDRHPVDEIKSLVAGQGVEHPPRALADQDREFVQMRRGEHRRDGLA